MDRLSNLLAFVLPAIPFAARRDDFVGQVANLRPIVNRPAASCHVCFLCGDAAMWGRLPTCGRAQRAPLIGLTAPLTMPKKIRRRLQLAALWSRFAGGSACLILALEDKWTAF